MKTIGSVILILLVVLLGLAAGGAVFTLLAYGVGMIVTRFTGLDPLPSTVISMAGMFLFGILVERTVNSFMSMPGNMAEDFDFDDSEDEDEEEEDFGFDERLELSEEELDTLYKGIPRWRRPLKNLDFSNVKPDDRCPCGSGRKFKNCHGKKPKETTT